jgi:outer membrane protein
MIWVRACGDPGLRLRERQRLGYTSKFAYCLRTAQGQRNQVLAQTKLVKVDAGFAGLAYNKEKKVNSRMFTPVRQGVCTTMIRTAALVAAFLFATAAGWAQETPAAGASAANKVGVIDVRQAIVNTAEGKVASAELQSQFAARQTELENMNKQLNDLGQRLQASAGKLSQEEEARLTAQGQRLRQQIDRKQNEYQEDVNAAQGEVIDRIGRKLVDVLDRYAREHGYAAVFDSSAQNSPILYKSNQIDVTQDIIHLYDQAYPVKAATTAPAQTKPAPKPAATQPPAQKPPQQ